MKRPSLVSIIIPAYNYAHFLPFTLKSAIRQDVDREIIVVDDGSTDNTQAACEPFADQITFMRQENKGLSAARNRGIEAAGGSFLVFLDSDDLLPPRVLSSQLRRLEEQPDCGLAVCRSEFFADVDAAGEPLPQGEWRLFRDDLDVHLCHFNIAPPHAFMTRRETVEAAGGFDTGLKACEDHDFWFRLTQGGSRLAANHRAHVLYRRHPDSMSRNAARQHAHDAMLHQRIANALLHGGHLPDARLEGLVACLAGCLLTGSRLIISQPDAANALLRSACQLASRIHQESPHPGRVPHTLKYFALRIRRSLIGLAQERPAEASEIAAHLQLALPSHFPAGNAALAPDIEAALSGLDTVLYRD
ncbi:glycosyltransferase family 2 protein [Desulfolutivibrio sp.]|uniref:glycosyltransferase family 2 protein n=1 Tax=Desulfolutivibrio sp. TaxID=2773296 RepID=UPI002F96099B